MTSMAVIGTGAWGTTVAVLLAQQAEKNGGKTLLFGRNSEKVQQLANTRLHPSLPDIVLPETLTITADPQALRSCDLIFWAVPTQATRAMAERLATHLSPTAAIISLSKGLEQSTYARVSQILINTIGERPCAVLSGPSMANECARGQPFALVIAGDAEVTNTCVERLHSPRCRLYTSSDMLGVELAGALKNVIAIAAGICDGMQLGDNAKAAIITRGLAEIRRLGRALGAHDATFAGMAGIGDLLTSCYSPLGRNRSLGHAIAAGENPQSILASRSSIAEGAWTCRAATLLGEQHGIELPIASQVAKVIWDATQVTTAMENLLTRTPKEEDA